MPLEPTGNGAQLSFAEENGQALGQRRHKRKRKKLLERAALEREKGKPQSPKSGLTRVTSRSHPGNSALEVICIL